MIVKNLRNLIASGTGFVVFSAVDIALSFIVMMIFPETGVEENELLYNGKIIMVVTVSILAAFTAGYVTGGLTSKQTVEWSFPTMILTVLMVIMALSRLFEQVIAGNPIEGIPYWFPFAIVFINTIFVPVGGYIGFNN